LTDNLAGDQDHDHKEGTRLIVSIVNDGRPFSIEDWSYIMDSIHNDAVVLEFPVIYVVNPMQDHVLELHRPRIPRWIEHPDFLPAVT
jgi:hypothetical protein